MPKVTIIYGENTCMVSADWGQSLSDLLNKHIIGFAMPCAGNHTCGKCLVQVQGDVSPMDEIERNLLGERAQNPKNRLACFCKVAGDMIVIVPVAGQAKILSWYQIPEMKETEHGYGFAVDIGTTTVAVQLVDRTSGRIVAERTAENAQRSFGADVISRIEACKTEGVQTLSDCIAQQLESMARECLLESGVEKVEESVVTGNSTMLHLYEGLDPASLAVMPFAMKSCFDCMSRRTLADAPVYLPRCISAYVGADITCAILAAELSENGIQLLADIGTNGEIVLARNGKLVCCSTAAGPAFEGAGLSQGMTASAGAIRAVKGSDEGIAYETVGHALPVGICGSGILDALAVMLKTETMEDTGYLEEDWEIGNSGVFVTQRDVRQIQLAKAAICGGIRTLLQTEELDAESLDRFVVAGGFGSSMDHRSAAEIGLYPNALRDKAVFLGNGALAGAVMLLCNRSLREKASDMAGAAEELSLSASADFMDNYVDCMTFGTF